MPPPAPRRLVVLDFDGTVAVGDAPVRAYLEAVLQHLPDARSEATSLLEAHLRSGPEEGGAPNEYALVASVARGGGVSDAVRQEAYAASRDALHDGAVEVGAPVGLAELLARRPAGTICVLVTNAPVAGIEPVLERLGLADRFDELVGDAGKPDGMPAVLERLLAAYGVRPERLLAVGDLWANDLEPAAAVGGTTAHIDRYGRDEGTPTFRARTLEALVPEIERWWTA